MQQSHAPSDGPDITVNPHPHQSGNAEAGRDVYRFETFGNEGFWTDAARLPKGLFAEGFIQPNELMPPATLAGRLVREAVMPLDWRLLHAAIEFTDDLENVSAVLTRKQLEIEPE